MNQQVESAKLLKILRTRKLPEFKDLPDVCRFVTKFVTKQYNLSYESDINRGYCFIWAYLVWALSKEEVHFATSDGHVVVDHNGFYYDSSNPDGYEYMEAADLHESETRYVDVYGMAWYWTRCGTAKKEFRSLLRRTCNKLYNSVRVGGFDDKNSWFLCVEDIP